MNPIDAMTRWLTSSPWVERGTWTLIHSLWQLTVVAGILALIDRWGSALSAQVRYLAATASLALMLVLPVLTFALIGPAASVARILPPTPHSPVVDIGRYSRGPAVVFPASSPEFSPSRSRAQSDEAASSSIPLSLSFQGQARQPLISLLPWLIPLWGLGVISLSVWHLGGWIATQRLRSLGIAPVSEHIEKSLHQLARRMGLNHTVRIAKSVLAPTPLVIGFFRPMILVPTAVLAGLSPAHLEAILAHELAHVRRHDYLVNLFQVLVETVLFYHPAVWWASRHVREEREHCCDDVAAAVCGNRRLYAEALVSVEELRPSDASFALAATGGGQMYARIQRVLGLTLPTRGRRDTPVALLIFSLGLLAIPSVHSRLSAQSPAALTASPAVPGMVRVQVRDAAGNSVPIDQVLVLNALREPGNNWVGFHGSGDKDPHYPDFQQRNADGSVEVNAADVNLPGAARRFVIHFRSAPAGPVLMAGCDFRPDPSRLDLTLLDPTEVESATAPWPITANDVAGIVVDSTGHPVIGATVTIEGSYPATNQEVSNGDGTFIFRHFGDSWNVVTKIEKAGYATRWLTELPVGQWFTVRLDNSSRLAGNVMTASGLPVAGVTLRIDTAKLSRRVRMGPIDTLVVEAVADRTGHFDVPLEPGEYEVSIEGPNGTYARQVGVRVLSGHVTDRSLRLTPGTRFKVVVVDSTTRKPLAGVRVIFNQKISPFNISWLPSTERLTNAEGVAEWNSIMPGLQTLYVSAASYVRARSGLAAWNPDWTINYLPVNVQPGEMTVPIELEPGVHLTGRVAYPDGSPATGLAVAVRGLDSGDMRYQRVLDRHGGFDFFVPATLEHEVKPLSISVLEPNTNGPLLASSPSFVPAVGAIHTFDLVVPESKKHAGEFPNAVNFITHGANFKAGDELVITRVTGQVARLEAGQTYCVEGRYTLASCDQAILAFVAETGKGTPLVAAQKTRIVRGTGTFRLIALIHSNGFPHLSLYPAPAGGKAFGSVSLGPIDAVVSLNESIRSIANRIGVEYDSNPW